MDSESDVYQNCITVLRCRTRTLYATLPALQSICLKSFSQRVIMLGQSGFFNAANVRYFQVYNILSILSFEAFFQKQQPIYMLFKFESINLSNYLTFIPSEAHTMFEFTKFRPWGISLTPSLCHDLLTWGLFLTIIVITGQDCMGLRSSSSSGSLTHPEISVKPQKLNRYSN